MASFFGRSGKLFPVIPQMTLNMGGRYRLSGVFEAGGAGSAVSGQATPKTGQGDTTI